ncbi:MAG: hypothetical protein WC869_01715 [Phycisphaerae bacterium]|jgi:hypothetical protein
MRIDGVNNLNSLVPQEFPEGKGAPRTPAAASSEGAEGITAAAGQYVAQVTSSPDVNVQAVAEARALLASGQLDTPEAALRAAARIMELGI